jgi:hypothetical protein
VGERKREGESDFERAGRGGKAGRRRGKRKREAKNERENKLFFFIRRLQCNLSVVELEPRGGAVAQSEKKQKRLQNKNEKKFGTPS